MAVVQVAVVWMGSCVDGWKEDWRMDGREGWVTPGTHQKETEWGKQEERKKGGHGLSSLFFLFGASVTAAEACLLLLPFSWVDIWTLSNPLPLLYLLLSLPPLLLLLVPSFAVFNSIKLIYIIQTNSLITFSLWYNLLVSLNLARGEGRRKKEERTEVRKNEVDRWIMFCWRVAWTKQPSQRSSLWLRSSS